MSQKTIQEILTETAEFYNSSNRAIDDEGHCSYFTIKNDKILMCAVGRCFLHPKNFKNDTSSTIDSLMEGGEWDDFQLNFKPEYRGYNWMFWSKLQRFHDITTHWDENGLSEEGKKEYEALMNEFNSNPDKFKQQTTKFLP